MFSTEALSKYFETLLTPLLQERLAFCSHYKNLDALKSNPHYEYIQPPVGHFPSSRFDMFQEIFSVGLHHGSTFFCGLKKSGRSAREREAAAATWLPTSEVARRRGRDQTAARPGDSCTFTDLAEMVMVGVRKNERKKSDVVSASASVSAAGTHDPDSDDTGIMLS